VTRQLGHWWVSHVRHGARLPAATHGNDDDAFYERQEEYNAAELDLYQGIRRDLGIVSSESGGAPLPGSGWELVEETVAPAPAPE
jgi:hypothetical protein